MVVHEAFHYLKNKKKGKHKELPIKIDMKNAYDRVEWDFLAQVLLRLGFRELWVGRVMQCIDSMNFSLLLSIKKVAGFKPLRGLRQGDPLSPFLFIIVPDILSRMLISASNDGLLRGIRLDRGCPSLTHYFFF